MSKGQSTTAYSDIWCGAVITYIQGIKRLWLLCSVFREQGCEARAQDPHERTIHMTLVAPFVLTKLPGHREAMQRPPSVHAGEKGLCIQLSELSP